MDLSKLVNNDGPVQQTSSRPAVHVHQYGQAPVLQGPSAYPSTDHMYNTHHGQVNRQTSATGSADHAMSASYAPTLNTGIGQHQHYSSASASPYATHQPSPYGAQPMSGSRRSSNERMPATPLQLQPSQNTHHYTHSPSASSQHTHTPHSAHHSPMPALQYGGSQPGQPANHYQTGQHGGLAPPPHVRNSHSDMSSSPQQYRQPLGPPPLPVNVESPLSRRSSEQYSRSRAQSASVSPKTLPPRPSMSRETSHSDSSQLAPNGRSVQHQYHNHQSHSASPAPPSSSTATDRPPYRRSHTMEMKHLLTPTTESPPQLPAARQPEVPRPVSATKEVMDVEGERKKRPLEDADAHQRRPKRTRRHVERPPWAILSAKNPRSDGTSHQPAAVPSKQQGQAPPRSQQSQLQQALIKRENGPQQPDHSNGSHVDFERPWLNPLPFDMDLIHARKVMGAWEKSIRWNTPYPDMLRAVQDWLMHHLKQHRDVTDSPNRAIIEIEAKIGQLKRSDNNAKAALPILNMAVLTPNVNQNHRFESALELDDWRKVNEFLNDSTNLSKTPGRQAVQYSRVKETDSFLDLAPEGRKLLPDSLIHGPTSGRELSLRTTTNATGEVTARIVKVGIADLHIFNPAGYDCRISMNAEVKFSDHDIASKVITLPPDDKKGVKPVRHKDRISYKHLAYQVDLTNVNTPDMPPKYEIEIEVDAQVLSQQIGLMNRGQPHAFSEVVSGFLDNATFLMRQ